MAVQKKKCKICGAEYKACSSVGTGVASMNWRAVACCPEHGAEYFRLVLESRAKSFETAYEPEYTQHFETAADHENLTEETCMVVESDYEGSTDEE